MKLPEKREWKLGCIRELTVAAGLRALFAEFLGTFMLVMVATGGINPRIISQLGDNAPLFNFSTCWGVGMMVGLMIYTTCDVSGGHVNPAITLQFFLDTQISAARMVAYWGAQYSGAFSAAGLLWVIGNFEGIPQYEPPTFGDFSLLRALVFQVIGSWLMHLVTLAAIDPRRGHQDSYLQPFAIAMSIVLALLFMGPYVVTGLNPIVICWYIVSGNYWKHLWMFVFGPFLGSASATAIYNGVLCPYDKKDLQGNEHQACGTGGGTSGSDC